MSDHKFLFEVSWEVCNKVGGIYAVLQSKLEQAIKNFGDDYVLIGPWREQNKDFVELSFPFLEEIKKVLTEKGIVCHIGYWDTPSKPKVILIDFKHRHKIDVLLYALWVDFGVDSLASNYDYHEPILFSTAAGEAISILAESGLIKDKKILGHFHEWMCGAGLLYLKKHSSDAVTVFTTHATVLGRSLAYADKLVCDLASCFDADAEAHKQGVFAKFSLEKVSAREADYFTTVSNITANEAGYILGKYPDKIIWNGINVEQTIKKVVPDKIPETREKLLQVAGRVIGKEIGSNALLWVTSGRYEFHNKGYDLLLKTLVELEESLDEDSPPIVVFLLVALSTHAKKDSLLDADVSLYPEQQSAAGLATHRIFESEKDPILKICNELNLKNPARKVHIVFSDAYLNGSDGVFDLTYEQILSACDLSIFPSFYEPWGYTPLESIVYSTPTVTTDLSGFGCWLNGSVREDFSDAVFVLKRKEVDEAKSITELNDYLVSVIRKNQDREHVAKVRAKSLQIARLADWGNFYQDYLEAYEQAIKFNDLSQVALEVTGTDESKTITSLHEGVTTTPRLHLFQYECILPEKLSGLRELAYNFWWSWHEEAKLLFQKIDPILWKQTQHNPVRFLNLVSTHNLQRASEDDDYVRLYDKVITEFNSYIQTDCDVIKFVSDTSVSPVNPIAYFCMEYGVDECLPIYSGGLGILAGDYLKSMSDLHVPMVAIGLFYKEGYFLQKINAKGDQEASYEVWDPNQIPMKPVNDDAGKAILTSIEILERTIYAKAWEVKVGHVSLYLLDTDVPENSEEDQKITNSLYGGSREIRLIQEMVLGIGGARFLADKLNVNPALYHLNEGHSAFLLLERIRALVHQGISFDEASEIVRTSSVFTTHTPVVAGNEAFAEYLVKKYLKNYAVSRLGISFDKLMDLARDINFKESFFSMTALALRLTLSANAVSRLHGRVARSMWQIIWPGLLEAEVPIETVTNGVHLATWLGDSMRKLYEDYLSVSWYDSQHQEKTWEKVDAIPDKEVWRAHQAQKEKLIEAIKQSVVSQYAMRNENKRLINSTLKCLDSDTMIIGISRRFTAYKRNNLFLLDTEHLARILTNQERPVVILVSGKAHPADVKGKGLLREIIETLRSEIFQGHIIFLEEYNIGLAKLMVQGVDLWLNTPILGREACGTSGMKVGINGGLNFSTKDGWWEEAYNENIGWKIESLTHVEDQAKRSDIENMYLLETLESEIIPLYYQANHFGFNQEWVERMKASINKIACDYNAFRMVRDYVNELYSPVALRHRKLMDRDAADLKTVVDWQRSMLERFNTIKIQAVFINGIKNGKVTSRGLLRIKLLLYLGEMSPSELRVEFVLMSDSDGNGNGEEKLVQEPTIVNLRDIESDSQESGVSTYIAEYQLEDTGFYSYGVRVLPYNRMLFRQQDARIVYWG